MIHTIMSFVSVIYIISMIALIIIKFNQYRPHNNNTINFIEKIRNLGPVALILLIFGVVFGSTPVRLIIYILAMIGITYAALDVSANILNKLGSSLPDWILKVLYAVIGFQYFIINADFIDYVSLTMGDGYLSIDNFFSSAVAFIFPALFIFVITFVLDQFYGGSKIGHHSFKSGPQPKSPKNTAYYIKKGLSEEEAQLFRREMTDLRDTILTIETEMNKTAKLKAVNVRQNTVKIAQNFFRDIVKEPTRFHEASHTIYRILPSIADLSTKYNEINQHIAKNKQTYLLLEKSLQTIEKLSESLTESYLQFHEESLNELDDEISYAEKSIYKKHMNKE